MDIYEIRRNNLRRIILERKIIDEKDKEFASAINTDASNLSSMKKGTRNIGDSMARRIEAAADKPRGWLDGLCDTVSETPSTYEVQPKEALSLDTSPLGETLQGMVNVEYYDIAFSAGYGAAAENLSNQEMYPIPESDLMELGLHHSEVMVCRVKGDSMAEKLLDGDYVLIDKTKTRPVNNKVFAYRSGNDLFVKRFLIGRNEWIIKSDNEDKEAYPDLPIRPASEPLHILGQVVALVKRVMI